MAQLQVAADHLADAVQHATGSAPISISVTARTARGVGSVTVSVGGHLQDVELTTAAMELSPNQLAEAIKNAYLAACKEATGRARTLISDATREHPQFHDFFDELLPDDTTPTMPSDQATNQPGPAEPGLGTDDPDDDALWPTIRN